MIVIEKIQTYGWEEAVRGMRNPMNSWDKSDSDFSESTKTVIVPELCVGLKDYSLMKSLAYSGSDHAKYRRMIIVYMDITAPLYWWKEFDTYKVGTVANSCSTMHTIADKEFTLEDFSVEHLLYRDIPLFDNEEEVEDCGILLSEVSDDLDAAFMFENMYDAVNPFVYPIDILKATIKTLNECRKVYLETKNEIAWWQMIQLLPSSYNQKRTVMLNYEVLANMYHARKNHKLDEWRDFCVIIESLPYSRLITLSEKEESE